jgi:hypothetical protein
MHYRWIKELLPFASFYTQANRFVDICHTSEIQFGSDIANCIPLHNLICDETVFGEFPKQTTLDKTLQYGQACKHTVRITCLLQKWKLAIHEFSVACDYIVDQNNKEASKYLIYNLYLFPWKYSGKQELKKLIRILDSSRLDLLDNFMLRTNAPENDNEILRYVARTLQTINDQSVQAEAAQVSWKGYNRDTA